LKELHLDYETYSSLDITKCGVYRYCESEDFEILLMSYSVDGGEVKIADLANGEKIPTDVLSALRDDNMLKFAHNAQFERICTSRFLGLPLETYLSPKSWRCSMVWCAYLGLPLSLENAGAVLGLEKQKLAEGKDLIRHFCTPPRYVPQLNITGADDKWERFKKYCVRDTEVETKITERLSKFPLPDWLWEEFVRDQEMNDRGVLIDAELARQAVKADETVSEKLLGEMRRLTKCKNPKSVAQLKEWFIKNGVDIDSLGKKDIELVKSEISDKTALRVLELRELTAKSSIKKYSAMLEYACADNRARGCFQFYGAATGRESGRGIQMQNLYRNETPYLSEIRSLVKSGAADSIPLLYDISVPQALAELCRTALIPKEGCRFYAADFSAIEARVVAWFAKEEWVLNEFRGAGKIYEAAAASMYGVPKESIDKHSPLRQRGKQAVLACGYSGGVGAMRNMGAVGTDKELKEIVDRWRAANPNIVKLWYALEKAALTAVREKTIAETHGVKFSLENGVLFMGLPSGRRLAYCKPSIKDNKFGRSAVFYYGVGGNRKWQELQTYGGLWTENLVQATARDLLFYSLKTLDEHGFKVVGHVHDEVIIEAMVGADISEIIRLMCKLPDWAEGLPLTADGEEMEFYHK